MRLGFFLKSKPEGFSLYSFLLHLPFGFWGLAVLTVPKRKASFTEIFEIWTNVLDLQIVLINVLQEGRSVDFRTTRHWIGGSSLCLFQGVTFKSY